MPNDLTRLLIKNFQAHEKLDLKLEQITVLVGDSDVGKSAVLRALRWLATNKPGGAEFIKEGTETCHVRLKVGEHTIVRERGKENTYQIDATKLKSFGTTVPDQVDKLLNVDPALNFQDQHDAVFWFSESPGEVAKQLNAIANLDGIDRIMAESQRRSREAKSVADVVGGQLKDAEQTLGDLAYVPKLNDDWRAYTKRNNEFEELRDGTNFLQDTLKDLEWQQSKVKLLGDLLTDFDDVATIDATLQISNKRAVLLKQTLQSIRNAQAQIPTEIPDLAPLERRYQASKEHRLELERLSQVIDDWSIQETRIATIQQEAQQAEMELQRTAKDSICPTCGQKMKL